MRERDTIAAISTALGEAGIGIVRISGPRAIETADGLFRPKNAEKRLTGVSSHTIHYGYIEEKGEVIDEVLVLVMKAPRTYTAEDTVEIDCHGGIYAVKRTLEAVLHAGVRLADPGEFTKRAFLNGRIDLSQAEAVIDVIQARNDYALKSSVSQLKGAVSRKVGSLREQILYQTARIEAALDDPEHYTLNGFAEELLQKTREWEEELNKLVSSAENGRLIREGIRTVILGKPNAGKSSLMNCLLGEERAIVTQIAGTTRDVLNEIWQLGEITLNLSDTAGIRKTEDVVEKIGVDRAIESAREADLILYVADCSCPLTEEDDAIMRQIAGKTSFFLLNKSDLPARTGITELSGRFCQVTGQAQCPPVLQVSMKDGRGIDRLEEMLKERFYQGEISFNDQVIITNVRQKHLLEKSLASILQVRSSIEASMPEDFYTIDLMDAYALLGEILGEAVDEDLAEEIFGRFCMGK